MKEAERWAKRFDFLHTEYGADCSGCDSADMLDLVEVEVRQVINKYVDEVERLKTENQKLTDTVKVLMGINQGR